MRSCSHCSERPRRARAIPGARRYVFTVTPSDRDQYLLVSEWDTQAAMDAHHRSDAFARYQFDVGELLARPSEMCKR